MRNNSILAPSGRLRVAINTGNMVIAQRGEDGKLAGVSVALANRMASALGVAFEPVEFGSAGQVTAATGDDKWDVAFLAIDALRAKEIAFTAPYALIQATYLVRGDSPFQRCADVDVPGATVITARGAAYDLHLQRTLRHARLVHTTTPGEAAALFHEGHHTALAGVRQALTRAATPDERVLPDAYLEVGHALAVPAAKRESLPWLEEFIATAKREGFVAQALAATGQGDVPVPAA